MHGRLKVRSTGQQKMIEEMKKEAKLKEYKMGMQLILGSRRKDSYDKEAFACSSGILRVNPHIYTLWNYRKEVLLIEINRCKKDDENDNLELLRFFNEELNFVENCLISSPKCYSSWHHRYWVLEHHPNPNWTMDLDNCLKFLRIDDRNLHCWDYRRLMLNKTDVSLDEELKFSTVCLKTNFSNYSSWHYRSTLRILDVNSLEDELNLVINAVYTDPYDSSAWFYFRWILSHGEILKEKREKVLNHLIELEQLEPDCKWVAMAKDWASHTRSYVELDLPKLIKLDPLRKGKYIEELKKTIDSVGDNK